MLEGSQNSGWLLALSLVLSTVLHLGIALGWFLWPPEGRGAVEIETAAISINLQATEIIDAARESAVNEAASAAAIQQTGGAGEPDKAEEQPKPVSPDVASLEQERLARELQRQQLEREQLEAEQAAELARQKKLEEDRKRRRAEAERQRRKKKAEVRKKKKRRSGTASANARGKRGSAQSAGAISASTGQLRDYGARVRAKIARSGLIWNRDGVVVVTLQVSLSGHLVSARIAQSSGNRELDRKTLRAVRHAAPFPKPPKGAKASQLYFNEPFGS